MAAGSSLAQYCNRLHATLSKEDHFVDSLSQICLRSPQGWRPLGKRKSEELCEMSFLLAYTSWEQFLDSSYEFCLAVPEKHIRHLRRMVTARNLGTASELMKGDWRSYVDWSDPDIALKRARTYFLEGEPFATAISGALIQLRIMHVVRDSIAHRSKHSADKLEARVRDLFGSRRNLTPGGLLLAPPPPRLVPTATTVRYPTTFKLFLSILDACSHLINSGVP